MNQTKILSIIAAVVVIAGALFFIVNIKNNTQISPPVACTLEAKTCPDGSAVGRTGPNCESAPCTPSPTPSPAPASTGYVAGHITIGPSCPVERTDQPCPVPPSAYSSREIIVYGSDSITVITKGKIDTAGNYKISLISGSYYVQVNPAGIGAGEKKKVVITDKKTSTVDFDIDTGIR